MATLIEDLVAELNGETINKALQRVTSNRPSFLASTAGFASPEMMDADKKHQWLDYKMNARSGVLGGVLSSATALDSEVIPVVDGKVFRSTQTVRNKLTGEVMMVDSVSGNNVTFIRGINGSAPASATGAELSIIGTAREENSLAATDGIFMPDKRWNYFQTFDAGLEFSDEMMKAYSYGDTNNLQLQLDNQLLQLQYQLNQAALWGPRASVNLTSTGKKSTVAGGLRTFIESAGDLNIDNSGAALTLEKINGVYESVFNKGGMVNRICVGTSLGRKLNALVSANYNSQRLQEWTSDQGSITMLPSDLPLFGGVQQIVIDNNLGADELFMYDSSRIQVVPVAANQSGADGSWTTKDATTPGQDGSKVRIIGKLSFRFRDYATHMARIHNIG